MNLKYVPILFIILITLLTACKKESYSVEGKWQESKMRRYNRDIKTGYISGDTVYQADTFGGFDYLQFNSNGTCIFSGTGLINNSLQQLSKVQSIKDYTYVKSGTGFALTPTHTDPYLISDVYTVYTVSSVSRNTLVLHGVASNIDPYFPYQMISDSYYTK